MTTEFVISLDEIAETYSVFEEDQVLTYDQLNSVTEYLDDQQRLTRVHLIGAGIACGLWPSLVGREVHVSRGVGVTTDGDLMLVAEDSVYDRFRPYDPAAPVYRRFMVGRNRIPLFELLRKGERPQDEAGWSLLGRLSGNQLQNMVVLLHMQSYVKDDDLCTGTDCDNKGKGAKHVLKVLLTTAAAVREARLLEEIDTTIGAARKLRPVTVRRPILTADMTSAVDISRMYQEASRAINAVLLQELARLYRSCEGLLRPVFAEDPAPGWERSLRELAARADVRGSQYYYDFLKDLAETYNAFLELYGDTAVCCPDTRAFEKHLLLGNLVRGEEPEVNRTGWYPSRAADCCSRREHARFLVRKLDTLIRSFAVPRLPAPIRITPSASEERSLEARAIPYYYATADQYRVRRHWSHEHARRDRAAYLYGYHARDHGALGAAMQPLAAQIGCFDFFRIEGHVGRGVSDAVGQLRRAIAESNLPLQVQALRLNREVRWVFPEPPFHVTELHGLRHILREDLATMLEDAAGFGGKLQGQIGVALRRGEIRSEDNAGVPIKEPADEKVRKIASQAPRAARMLRTAGTQDWQTPVSDATVAAAGLKDHLARVSKNRFVSPLDKLIESPHSRWLSWLDDLIKDREDKEANKSMLPGFLERHPGLEHYAGVARGGTFVVVYDEREIVVADFMLPYLCCEPQRYALPPLRPPPPKPGILTDRPIWLTPVIDKLRFSSLAEEVKGQARLDKRYFEGFKESLAVLGGALLGGGRGGAADAPTVQPTLAGHMSEYIKASEDLRKVEAELRKPRLTAAKRGRLEAQLKGAQDSLDKAASALKIMGIG